MTDHIPRHKSWDEIGQEFYNDLYERTKKPRNTEEKRILLGFADYLKRVYPGKEPEGNV